jgi:2-hydroxychromene-2-carboxylate isomerase
VDQPVFYYDLASPQCYVVGETIMSTLPVVPEWEPVLESQIAGPAPDATPDIDRLEIGRLAEDRGLQPIRWPATWPPSSERAMLAATYAKRIGRAVAFSLAAFRQTFAGGRDLGDESTVLIAGAACEMHPVALIKGLELVSTRRGLEAAGDRALAAGVRSLPAIQIGERVFAGADALGAATVALGGPR